MDEPDHDQKQSTKENTVRSPSNCDENDYKEIDGEAETSPVKQGKTTVIKRNSIRRSKDQARNSKRGRRVKQEEQPEAVEIKSSQDYEAKLSNK